MSAQPDDITAGHDVIHLGGQVAAVVVPLEEYRLLKLLEGRATAEEAEEAAVIAAYLADKEGMRARGITDDELDAVLSHADAGNA